LHLRSISDEFPKGGKRKQTLRRSKGQLISARSALWYAIPLTEHVGVKLAKLDCTAAHALHPTLPANVFRHKGGPYGYGLHGTTARSGFEPDAARVFVAEDAECVEVPVVLDLAVSH
jgi:hypothetical protein